MLGAQGEENVTPDFPAGETEINCQDKKLLSHLVLEQAFVGGWAGVPLPISSVRDQGD